MKDIHIAASPLTGTVFAGHILKNGTWAAGKQDKTIEALVAVAEHALKHKANTGDPVKVTDSEGRLVYTIEVTKGA